MSRPIILWDTRRHTSQTSDEAGTTISKSVHPPTVHVQGPYESETDDPRVYVPSLLYFALKSLFEYPEQIHALGPLRLRYQVPSSSHLYDVLRELIPCYDPSDPDFSLNNVDPRLWATIVQVFSDLPDTFRTYRIPLADKHVPLLQQIPSTPHFSLITILELSGCLELTDETIIQLKCLSGLCALDASGTELSTHGLKNLSRTLMWSEDDNATIKERRGPWAIRILNLQNCMNIDNGIFICLPKFVLLSVIDLRGTRCNPNTCDTKTFRPSSNKSFFHPSPLSSSLFVLSTTALGDSPVFSSSNLYTLHITSLNHGSEHQFGYSPLYGRRQARPKPPVNMQDAYVVLPPLQSYTQVKKTHPQPDGPDFDIKPKIKVGNSHTLEWRRQRREEMENHERNKEAWYERNDQWARDSVSDWPVGYDDPYGDGNPHSGMEEEGISNEDEDESEDDDLDEDSSDGMELDQPSLHTRPQADVPTSTLTRRANSDTRAQVSEGIPSGTSESSSGGQPLASTSQLSHPVPADRPVVVSNLSGAQIINREYRRRPLVRAQLSDIIRNHPNDNTNDISERQLTISSSDNAHSSSELTRQMVRPVRSTPSTVLDVRRTERPEVVPTSQLGPSRSAPPTLVIQSVLPDVDIRTSVASEEARIYATRQAAAAFYLDASVGTSSSTNRIRQRPSYLLCQGRGRSGTSRPADEQLMLFRDPPPWSILEDTRTAAPADDAKGKQHALECVAVLRSSTTGAAGMKELLQMIKRRKLSEPNSATKLSNQPKTLTNPIPRNPFRKHTDAEYLAHASGQRSSTSRPPLATLSAPSQLNLVADGSAKPFKRTSVLMVPALPEELRPTQAKGILVPVQMSSARKGQSLDDDDGLNQASVSRTDAANASLSKNVVRKSKPANLEPKFRSQGPLPNLLYSAANRPAPSQSARVSIKPSNGMTSKRKSRSGKVPAAFDWKGWSDK